MLSFPGPSKWSTGLCRARLGLAASAAPTPSRAARIYADIQQSFGARDRATLTMRVVRLSCCFVWFDLARCQMVFPEQRGVMHTRRGPALSARPLACLYILHVFVLTPVRVRLEAERAISVAGSDLREIDLASSVRHVVISDEITSLSLPVRCHVRSFSLQRFAATLSLRVPLTQSPCGQLAQVRTTWHAS
jgi:hypothetical protein